ncbi:MAG: DotU family type VI secretion system protein [Rhodocyclaceae bacterium]
MSQDDPFAPLEGNRTVILPTPGGRATASTATTAAPRTAAFEEPAHVPAIGLNPLLAAANPLLNLVPQLRGTLQHNNPAGLKEALANQIRQFEARAKTAGVAAEKVIAARYTLCTLLDETAASTPWGGSGVWSAHSLLVMFHNETWGGEKVFQLLGKLAENPGANRDILELLYVVLGFGFEGRYRVMDNGRSQLEALRERLAQMLRNQRGEYEHDLSPHWQGVAVKKKTLSDSLPLWVAGAVAGVLLLGIYIAFSTFLNRESDPVFSAIQGIRAEGVAPRAAPSPGAAAPVAKPRLAGFLQPEIQAGLVAVQDKENLSIITIRGDGFFEPGSATVAEKVRPLLARIAAALNTVPGQVQVVGHTDNVPIHSARFPSNWHLSQDRAKSVLQILATTVTPARLSAEGRAEAEPVAPNDTPANRARNRRVEITLFAAPKAP